MIDKNEVENKMVNKNYSYPYMDLWEEEPWKDRYSKIDPLAKWVSAHAVGEEYAGKYPQIESYDPSLRQYYKKKDECLELPEFVKDCHEHGFLYESHEMGGNTWLSMMPEKLSNNTGRKYPLILVEHLESDLDPNWAMRTIDSEKAYQDLALRENMILVYNVRTSPDERSGYATILGEILLLFPVDPDKILFDVSPAVRAGISLKDLEGFSYIDQNGEVAEDPDRYIQSFPSSEIKLLNISHQYERKTSDRRAQLTAPFNKNRYDFDQLKYSETGKQLAEAMHIEHEFDSAKDPAWPAFWNDMGLAYEEHVCKGERWISLIPRSLSEKKEKLPVMALMGEVNGFSDRLPIQTLASFFEYCKLAAQGEFALLVFALETPDANDLWCDILDDALQMYPLDESRIYMMGQSHNGHFTREFASRHADILAGAATLSNSLGLPRPENSVEAVLATDEFIEKMRQVEIPLIDLMGSKEAQPLSLDRYADEWQRRMRSVNCPEKSLDEIKEAITKGSPVEQKMKLLSDKTASFYIDGKECDVSYSKNKEGKYCFCGVLLENTPHYPDPCMAHFVWDYLRRFAREQKTGKVIQLLDI